MFSARPPSRIISPRLTGDLPVGEHSVKSAFSFRFTSRKGPSKRKSRERRGTLREWEVYPMRACPYFCIPPLPRRAFLADFIINYLNAFDSRILLSRPTAAFPWIRLSKPRGTRQDVSSFFSAGKSNITLMVIFISRAGLTQLIIRRANM